ncbi:hypothetical protein RJT34_11441 [Clitoria ternatea]|uniref:Cyclotide n=1 Tax=Clitoria ternatea TaxID=43366 RepID=A0AAN9JKI9_CLITE
MPTKFLLVVITILVVVNGQRSVGFSGTRRKRSAIEGVTEKGILRKGLKLLRNGAVEEVVGDIELVEDERVEVGDWAREVVAFKEKVFETGEVVEGGWEWAREVVEAQVEANQVGKRFGRRQMNEERAMRLARKTDLLERGTIWPPERGGGHEAALVVDCYY